jgi:hypothetical protein
MAKREIIYITQLGSKKPYISKTHTIKQIKQMLQQTTPTVMRSTLANKSANRILARLLPLIADDIPVTLTIRDKIKKLGYHVKLIEMDQLFSPEELADTKKNKNEIVEATLGYIKAAIIVWQNKRIYAEIGVGNNQNNNHENYRLASRRADLTTILKILRSVQPLHATYNAAKNKLQNLQPIIKWTARSTPVSMAADIPADAILSDKDHHGHVTPTYNDYDKRLTKQRCGGPGRCATCGAEWQSKYGAAYPEKKVMVANAQPATTGQLLKQLNKIYNEYVSGRPLIGLAQTYQTNPLRLKQLFAQEYGPQWQVVRLQTSTKAANLLPKLDQLYGEYVGGKSLTRIASEQDVSDALMNKLFAQNYGEHWHVPREPQPRYIPWRKNPLLQTPPITAAVIDGDKYFKLTDLTDVKNSKSRQTLVYMSPDDFLLMAKLGDDPGKTALVAKLVKEHTVFNSTPFLSFTHDGKGLAQVIGHEGRHRVRGLKHIGIKQIPVILNSIASAKGAAIRWGSQQPNSIDKVAVLPTKLRGEDKRGVINMPHSVIYPTTAKAITTAHSDTHSKRVTDLIVQQLGGTGKLAAMLGAKNFVRLQSGLQFDLSSRGSKNKANKIAITYDPGSDEYCMIFYRLRNLDLQKLSAHPHLQVSQLKSVITRETGLDLHL